MFARTISLIGNDNLELIKSKTVLVVGLGGVGGYVVENLIRSGIENIILVDYDTISLSNLNRQIISTRENIGNKKTIEFKKRINSINPKCNVTTFDMFLESSNINILDNYKIDYIADACDTVKTKELLIDYSIKNNIKLISSMGTGNKFDPSKLTITDIRKTSYDPLAKIIRKYVISNHIKEKIMVVSSIEPPIKSNKVSSIAFVPASSGILISSYIINDILKNNH